MSPKTLSSHSQQMYAEQAASRQAKAAAGPAIPIPITPSQEATVELEYSLNELSAAVDSLEDRAHPFLRPEPLTDEANGQYNESAPASQIVGILKEAAERVRRISNRVNGIIDRLE